MPAPKPQPAATTSDGLTLSPRQRAELERWRATYDLVAYGTQGTRLVALLDTHASSKDDMGRWRARFLFANGIVHGEVHGPRSAHHTLETIRAAGGVVLTELPPIPDDYTWHY